jgi:hypothetical protein
MTHIITDLDHAIAWTSEHVLRVEGRDAFESDPGGLLAYYGAPFSDDLAERVIAVLSPWDADEIARIVRDTHGVPCYVEHTGGGCATIYAGTPYTDAEGDPRYPAIAGPGYFVGGNRSNGARFHRDECYVGPDDDGETVLDPVHPGLTPEGVARRIAEQVTATESARDLEAAPRRT